MARRPDYDGKTLATHVSGDVARVIAEIAQLNGRSTSQEIRFVLLRHAELHGRDADLPAEAKYLAPGRCPRCGNAHTTWTAGAIVAAARAWIEKHGRPPNLRDWNPATPENPSYGVVQRMFGSWNNMVVAAGAKPRKGGGSTPRWTKDDVAEAMLDQLLKTGMWPTTRDWRLTGGESRPCTSTVLTLFPTWNDAKRYAGWDGTTNGSRQVKAAA